ncbi:MAG: response regulator [Alphaproteobacteria bacterium]|nr:response regulator [Alphaproteobacteria bacterium]
MDSYKSILLVDDNLFIQEIVADFLRNSGYRVEAAANGNKALLRLREKSFDLVLTDLIMPQEDGFSLISSIKKLPTPPLIIVMTSGSNDKVFQEKLKALQDQGVKMIWKPFSKEDLLQMVNDLLYYANPSS